MSNSNAFTDRPVAMSEFRSLLTKTDVTALKIVKCDYLLAGIGNVLHAFRLCDLELMCKMSVFVGQSIHGVVPSKKDDSLLIYGGKRVRRLSFRPDDPTLPLDALDFDIHLDDWSLAIIWIRNYSQIAVLTAHNIVQIWDISTKSQLETHRCEEKCILYSGLLYELDSDVLIFSGTVFSQVVIWSTNNDSVLHRLSGHKGVIFSTSLNTIDNIIVTTSDDRSVRIWFIDKTRTDESDGIKNLKYWQNVNIVQKSIAYGHSARVMRSVILNKYILSIGEDSNMCVWNYEGQLVNKLNHHQEGSLWSIDYNVEKDIIVTGASDSGITMHNLTQSVNPIESNLKELSETKVNPKKLGFTYRGNIACLSENGNLLYYDFELENYTNLQQSTIKFSNLSISKCGQFIALSNMTGSINIYAETCKYEPTLILCINQQLIDTGLLSLHWLHDRKIITCDKVGTLNIWSSVGEECTKCNEHILPACKERWLTAALIIFKPRYMLVIGDRCGNMHVYNENSIEPNQTLVKVHGRLGINSIEISNGKISTTGRDGTVKYFDIQNDRLIFQHSIKFPFVWIERFISAEKILCGFRESHFIIWDVATDTSLLDLNCGGGHRSWDVHKTWNKIDKHLRCCLRLAFIKNSSIHCVDVPLIDRVRSVTRGTHVREINIMETISMTSHGDGINFVIASGGEDNSVRFHDCRYVDGKFTHREMIVLKKHLSAVKCLSINHQDSSKSIIFSAGGRAQICAWRVSTMDPFNCWESGNILLKGSDLERKGKSGWKTVQIDTDAETRIMSLTCFSKKQLSDHNINNAYDFLLIAGCSDGCLKLLSVKSHEESYSFELFDEWKHVSRCILNVHHLIYDSNIFVFATATNGTVTFWNLNELLTLENQKDRFGPIYSIKLHKAGINSFDVDQINGNSFMLVTGGDDNDLRATVLSFDGSQSISKVADWHHDGYHCSQITGIRLINGEYILSASIDQRVTLLSYDYASDVKCLTCTFIDQHHASVPDVQGLNALDVDGKSILAIVYGKGFEIFTFKLPNNGPSPIK